MFYFYSNIPTEIFELSVENVKKIIKLNKEGVIPEKIENYIIAEEEKKIDFEHASGKDRINRFDTKKKKRKFKKRKK